MDTWAYLLIGLAATVVPASALSLLVRTENEKREEGKLPRWARAKNMVSIALGGSAAVDSLPSPKPRVIIGDQSGRVLSGNQSGVVLSRTG
ncbi:MAG: hypothetical protein HYV09_12205 [Deltaproteobacteria bacterium]|nr:hypothetical protein [Deltaproteobacteria bacterium]